MFALEDPSYEKIRLVYEANGADCVMLKMGADGIRSDALFGCAARCAARHAVSQLSERRDRIRLKAA